MTVKKWCYIFDRDNRFRTLEESFIYCQNNMKLKVYAYVFMLNHIHFIGSSNDLSQVLCSMKSFLAKSMISSILKKEPNKLSLFETHGKHEFWERTNYPKLISGYNFFQQKVEYIHMNPVEKQYVHYPEDWKWSSASKIPTRIKVSEIE